MDTSLQSNNCHRYNDPACTCPRESAADAYYKANVNDIANTLGDVLLACGMHMAKVITAVNIIRELFYRYDNLLYGVAACGKARLDREGVFCELISRCLMNCVEAQLTYDIVIQALKAYYHNIKGPIKSRPNEAENLQTNEYVWVKAARHTTQIFENFKLLFYAHKPHGDKLIKNCYKRLYEDLKNRKLSLEDPVTCACKICRRPVGKFLTFREPPFAMESLCMQNLAKSPDAPANCGFKTCVPKSPPISCEQVHCKPTNATPKPPAQEYIPCCKACKFPKLLCDCDVDSKTGIVHKKYGQGPFQCQWRRVGRRQRKVKDPCIKNRAAHQCPIDCENLSLHASSEKSEDMGANAYCQCSEDSFDTVRDDGNWCQFKNNSKEKTVERPVSIPLDLGIKTRAPSGGGENCCFQNKQVATVKVDPPSKTKDKCKAMLLKAQTKTIKPKPVKTRKTAGVTFELPITKLGRKKLQKKVHNPSAANATTDTVEKVADAAESKNWCGELETRASKIFSRSKYLQATQYLGYQQPSLTYTSNVMSHPKKVVEGTTKSHASIKALNGPFSPLIHKEAQAIVQGLLSAF